MNNYVYARIDDEEEWSIQPRRYIGSPEITEFKEIEEEDVDVDDLINILNNELEGANHHSMMDMYENLHCALVATATPEDQIKRLFLYMADEGGIVNL